ncbi:FtsK/SpoIIIE domain-containing protein [Nocardia aurantia]|uniref:ESX secretion system protein EccC n=1 Tax=Nocardia aurantia TaxID=2585199 RepID=A0A7K0DKW9_9NOCA|nr:FtsK/SpoIIIE domain-containing protein [Nocardia aurantia]MQY26423.1 ESX secretion system protein EccC [Nocardia aurantia]
MESDREVLLGIDRHSMVTGNQWWRAEFAADRLCAPLGRTSDGRPLGLDFEAHGNGGVGPHGLLVGGTVAERAALIETLVLATAMTHGPDHLRYIYLDYAGRGSFDDLATLPHTTYLVSGAARYLAHERAISHTVLADVRTRDRLAREHFGPAGTSSGRPVALLPRLVIVVDDFARMLIEVPDFAAMIGHIARSEPRSGVHLLLCAHEFGRARVSALDGILGYRLVLRTSSPDESRAALGTPLAHRLTRPGSGYLRTQGDPVRFDGPDRPDHALRHELIAHLRAHGRFVPEQWRTWVAPSARVGDIRPVSPDATVDFAVLYGLDDPEHTDVTAQWRPRDGRLRIPIGLARNGEPIELDIPQVPERAANVAVIGAARSGRSELLATIVLGLALRYPPEAVSFFLADSHAGEAFAELAALPHVSAVVSDTAHEPGHTDRVVAALSAELARRIETLGATAKFTDIYDYEQARTAGADLDPLPTLVVVVDGVDDLLSRQPDLRHVLVALGRLGRSHGFVMVLAAERLSGDDMRGLETHLTTRIALGSLPADELRVVFGTADLGPAPAAGYAYLRTDYGPRRFRIASAERRYRTTSRESADRTLRAVLVSGYVHTGP